MLDNIQQIYPDIFGLIYDLVIHWKITDYCNLSCPGCTGNSIFIKQEEVVEKIDIRAIEKFLEKLKKRVKIIFTGGEPMLVENIIDVFSMISMNHYFGLITNLTSHKFKEFASLINPERVAYIKASAHIIQLEKNNLLKTYLENYHLLRNKGFRIWAEDVAYPVMADQVMKYKRLFHENGIDLKFIAFRGYWQNKKYPESYSENDYKVFDFSEISSASNLMHYRKNQPCNAGYNVIIAYKDGVINPCYYLSDNLGSLFSTVEFKKKLIRCPINYCDCPLPVFDPHLFKRAEFETARS